MPCRRDSTRWKSLRPNPSSSKSSAASSSQNFRKQNMPSISRLPKQKRLKIGLGSLKLSFRKSLLKPRSKSWVMISGKCMIPRFMRTSLLRILSTASGKRSISKRKELHHKMIISSISRWKLINFNRNLKCKSKRRSSSRDKISRILNKLLLKSNR